MTEQMPDQVGHDEKDSTDKPWNDGYARTLEGDPAFRPKLLKFGLSRGYDYDTVDAAVRTILHSGK